MMLTGCSKPVLKMSEPLPPIVKQYKHRIIYGDVPEMQNTGIYLNKGDIYSILATGLISFGSKSFGMRPGWGRLMARIGKKNYSFLPLSGWSGSTYAADHSGKLYLGIADGRMNRYGEPYRPKRYKDNTGSFNVDVIVWNGGDYVQIADFFEKMKEKDPKNKAIIDAHNEANKRKEIYLAEVKASKEIEETEEEIQKLKEESSRKKETIAKNVERKEPIPKTKPVTAELSQDEKIAQLQEKLSKLTETVAQLEGMKKQLEEEKKKTTLLSKELSDRERREEDLLRQLKHGEKKGWIFS